MKGQEPSENNSISLPNLKAKQPYLYPLGRHDGILAQLPGDLEKARLAEKKAIEGRLKSVRACELEGLLSYGS